MERRIIVVGDPPICGGQVLPYEGRENTIRGHQVALIGGRAFCEGCNSVGIIAKAGGPRRMGFITEIALEGDVVICHCPKPQPIKSVLQSTSTYDDMMARRGPLDHLPTDMMSLSLVKDQGTHVAMQKRIVDDEVTHPPEAQQIENICPNMTNKEFAVLVMKLRDEAIVLVAQRRQELERWDKVARERIKVWFGRADLETMRDYLQKGLIACDRALRELEPKNFVRWSPTALKHVNCVSSAQDGNGVVAEVCKPDVKTRTIAIAPRFCELPPNVLIHGTATIRDGDSKLLTIVHEVTHFDDTFGSHDLWYTTKESRMVAAGKSFNRDHDPRKTPLNADNIAAYIIGVEA